MAKFTAEVCIELKKGILDAEANVAKKSLELLGFKNISSVNTAKIFSIELNSKNKESAQKEVEEMCTRLLANPVINNYTITLR